MVREKYFFNMKSIAVIFLLSFSLSAVAQTHLKSETLRPLPSALMSRYSQIKAKLQPSVQAWVVQQGHSEAQKNTPDISGLETEIGARFGTSKPGVTTGMGGLATADIQALVFIVLMEAAKETQEDLKAIMNEVKKTNDSKQKMRGQLKGLQSEMRKVGADKKTKTCPVETCNSISQLAAEVAKMSNRQTRFNFTGAATVAEADAALTSIKDDLDSQSELSEQEQMKLQAATERMQKLEEALSDIMKKASQTSENILKNLK